MSSHPSSLNQPQPSSYVTDESEDDSSMDLIEVSSSNVRFANSIQVEEIPSRESFTEEEIRATWYKKEDYQAMRCLALETINLSRSGNLLPGDEEHCLRGLEGRTHEGFSVIKQNRRVASFAVIDEQDRQDEVGISDSDLLAEVYRSCTVSSQCVAFAQGLFDAQEVMRELFQGAGVPPQGSSPSPSSKPTATTSQVPVDQNALLLLINSAEEKEEMAVDSIAEEEVDEENLNSMEWTAEAA